MNDESALDGIAALANKSRWEIFWLLVCDENTQKSAGEIANRLNIAPATLSFHLKELTHAGLLQRSRSGSKIMYVPDRKILIQLADYIVKKCDGDNNDLLNHRAQNN